MRVKLQLVICHDDGQEETVTDVITLNKHNQRIEHLGLSLAESKQLLSTLQRHLCDFSHIVGSGPILVIYHSGIPWHPAGLYPIYFHTPEVIEESAYSARIPFAGGSTGC